jgi:DNA adenine methylase
MVEKIKIEKPFLKWVGGKTQIIGAIMEIVPDEFDDYHEIFIGGGSVLFAVLSYIKDNQIKLNKVVYAYDINEALINTYLNIKNKCNEVIKQCNDIIKDYEKCKILTKKKPVIKKEKDKEKIKTKRKPVNNTNNKKIAMENQESFYYWIRKNFNKLDDKTTPESSAMFIFLNKTCWRGVCRYNNKGEFNVPYGNYVSPSIIDEDHLKRVSLLIQDVEFKCQSFEESMKNIKKNDFVYLDPPYVPVKCDSFVSYSEKGFEPEMHKNLFELCHDLNKNDVKFLMSNSDAQVVSDAFSKKKSKKYDIKVINCRRMINSKNPKATANEVLITNF